MKKRGLERKKAKRIELVLKEPAKVSQMNRVVFWSAFLVLVVCNLGASLFLVPLLVLSSSYLVHVAVSLLGLVFGLLFNFLINNIEELEHRHHVTAIVLVPILAIVNLYIIVNVSNKVDSLIHVDIVHNPLIVAALYVLFFVVPYIIIEVRRLSH